MDRTLVLELLKNKVIQYPKGKHRIWVSRCFEINVRPRRLVEVDEYEGYVEEKDGSGPKHHRNGKGREKELKKMFHVGRSIVSLKEGTVTQERGTGWQSSK